MVNKKITNKLMGKDSIFFSQSNFTEAFFAILGLQVNGKTPKKKFFSL